MADRSVWDLDTPTPNLALERIRRLLLAVDDVYLVIDMLLGLLDDATAEREQLRTELGALTVTVTALGAQVAALSPPVVPDVPEEIP